MSDRRFALCAGAAALVTVAVVATSQGLGGVSTVLLVALAAGALVLAVVCQRLARSLIPDANPMSRINLGLSMCAAILMVALGIAGLIGDSEENVRAGTGFGLIFAGLSIWIYRRNHVRP